MTSAGERGIIVKRNRADGTWRVGVAIFSEFFVETVPIEKAIVTAFGDVTSVRDGWIYQDADATLDLETLDGWIFETACPLDEIVPRLRAALAPLPKHIQNPEIAVEIVRPMQYVVSRPLATADAIAEVVETRERNVRGARRGDSSSRRT